MKKITIGLLLGCIVVFASSFDTKNDKASVISTPSTAVDSIADERAKFVAEVMESIKGKEKMPADSVFKNIKMFKILKWLEPYESVKVAEINVFEKYDVETQYIPSGTARLYCK